MMASLTLTKWRLRALGSANAASPAGVILGWISWLAGLAIITCGIPASAQQVVLADASQFAPPEPGRYLESRDPWLAASEASAWESTPAASIETEPAAFPEFAWDGRVSGPDDPSALRASGNGPAPLADPPQPSVSLVQYELINPEAIPPGTLPAKPINQETIAPGTLSQELGYVSGYPDTMDYAGANSNDVVYGPQILPQGILYRAYLAGEKESRFRSVMNYERSLGWKWDISLGGHVGLFRYGSTGNARPEGFQVDIEGAGLLRLDPEEDRDVDAVDFRFGVPFTWGNEVHQVKFAYYHLSSHLADEFLMKNIGYPRLNFSRDVLVLGHSYYLNPQLRLYGEVGYALYSDVSLQWEFQFGVDYAPAIATGWRGAPFAAVNAHLREEVGYGGNFVVQAGWAWRRSPSSGLFRLGFQYFNGKSEQFSFFDNFESKYGFGVWYDY